MRALLIAIYRTRVQIGELVPDLWQILSDRAPAVPVCLRPLQMIDMVVRSVDSLEQTSLRGFP